MENKYKSKAEEVENIHKDNYDELLQKYNLALQQLNSVVSTAYTKEQVEELLQKQRELCYNSIYWKDDVDKDSILNAKLKI